MAVVTAAVFTVVVVGRSCCLRLHANTCNMRKRGSHSSHEYYKGPSGYINSTFLETEAVEHGRGNLFHRDKRRLYQYNCFIYHFNVINFKHFVSHSRSELDP